MDKNITINIGAGTIIKSILFVLLFALLFILRDLVLVILTAVVIASAVEPATRWFAKRKIPRTLAVLIVYSVVVVVTLGLVLLLLPPLIDEFSNLLTMFPRYFEEISLWSSSGVGEQILTVFSAKDFLLQFKDTISGATGGVWQIFSGVFGGVANFVLIFVLSFYLSVQESGVVNFLRFVTPIKQEKYVVGLWKRTQYKIGLWMQGQLLLGLLIGVLVFLGLTVLGIKYAFLLAVFAMFAELIPVFGPILAAIPAIAIGFATGGVPLGLMVVGFYVIIQQFENHLIYPLVVRKVVGVPPLLVILSLIVGAKLVGFLGIILSVPLAAALMEFIHDVEEDKKKLLEEIGLEEV